jgi:hypothetical protein
MTNSDADSDYLRSVLERAGWYEGRAEEGLVQEWSRLLDSPEGFRMSEPAKRALAEYGGLHLVASGPGRDFARGSVDFDPTLAEGEEARFDAFKEVAGSKLYPLGEAYGGHVYVAMDEHGGVYLLMDSIQRIGASIRDAVSAIVLGYRIGSGDPGAPRAKDQDPDRE